MLLSRALAIAVLSVLAVWLATGGASSAAAPLRAEPVLTLPVEGGRIVALATIPQPDWKPGHRGIDIRAAPDAVAVAPGNGRVAFVGLVAGRPVVSIDLDVGLKASLEPVTATVQEGARVARGDPVGVLADAQAHCAGCVHWGLRDGERYVDPLDWLEGYGRIVLLPARSRPRPMARSS